MAELEVLSQIKENCNISEASTSGDIATIQDFISHLIDEKYNDSLAYLISEVQPLDGSWGSAFASMRNNGTNNFEIVKRDIYTKTFKIDTGYTQEVWQDMIRLFNKRAKTQAGNILSGISAQVENEDVIKFISANALTKTTLQVNINNTAWITSQISMRVAESVVEMNRVSFKSLDSFCILSPKWASAFLGTAGFVKSDKDSDSKDSTLFVGRYGRTDFYLNPFDLEHSDFSNDYNNDYGNDQNPQPSGDYCYIGLKSDITGNSSLIFAPYMYESQIVNDPDTGNDKLFIYNRYGLVTSPLHEPFEGKSMLHKFIIEETP